MKLLVTSVGSLLGQNILDSIESRRHLIQVIGTNTIAENPRNFRCDIIYHVHNTKSDRFYEEFDSIVRLEKPDLILPGRDDDCLFLAEIKKTLPEKFVKAIPCGSPIVPRIMFDKYESFLFCQKHHLPFADTFLFEGQDHIAGLNTFIEKHGFPLVFKPREGFGSNGVIFVLNHDHINEITRQGESLFQEYLGKPEHIFNYKDSFKKGIPLFFQIPEVNPSQEIGLKVLDMPFLARFSDCETCVLNISRILNSIDYYYHPSESIFTKIAVRSIQV